MIPQSDQSSGQRSHEARLASPVWPEQVVNVDLPIASSIAVRRPHKVAMPRSVDLLIANPSRSATTPTRSRCQPTNGTWSKSRPFWSGIAYSRR